VILQRNGAIDVVGVTADTGVAADTIVYRLLPDGHPDPTFDLTGQLILANDGNDFGFGIGLEPDGSIVVSSYQAQRQNTVTDAFLTRVCANGQLDDAFGTAGTVRVHNPEATFELGLSIQRDGKIVVAGRRGGFNIVDSIGTIDRFNPDGSFDTTP
jgi:uncharacterized delta-60 repeat protein